MTGLDRDQERIHVVMAADARYAMPLATAICSAAANCDRRRGLTFNVFQQGMSAELQRKVEISLERAGCPDANITWREAPTEQIAGLDVSHPWTTPLTFVRLLIPELLPSTIRRSIYIDCDVVVNADLAELWDMDFHGTSLCAARDRAGTVGGADGFDTYRELGIPSDAKYFNAGVMLLNLEKWRADNTSGKLLRYLIVYRDVIKTADQEALNAVLWNDWNELDFGWNWQIVWRGYRRGTHKMDWVPPVTEKRIIHYVSSEKPWLPGCDYEEKAYFRKYIELTEWSGWRISWSSELVGRVLRVGQDIRNDLGRLRRRMFDSSPVSKHSLKGSREVAGRI